jgi:hypothetical protein
MATVITDATDALAHAKYAEYSRFISAEGHLARLSAILQLDLTALDLDVPLEYVETDGIRGVLDMYTRLDPDKRWTPRAIAEFLGIGGGGAVIVGGPTTVADELERWFEEGGIDGFNMTDPMPLQTYPEFNQFVLAGYDTVTTAPHYARISTAPAKNASAPTIPAARIAGPSDRCEGEGIKVFWFFFSKKNTFFLPYSSSTSCSSMKHTILRDHLPHGDLP